MTTIHVRYEILDDPRRPHPDSAPDAAAWGVRAVGLPDQFSAYGVGDTLEEPLHGSVRTCASSVHPTRAHRSSLCG
jgi:hypothetical protein